MSNKNEILLANYWEHFKYAKDIAMFLPVGHPKRLQIEETVRDISNKLNENHTPKNDDV